MIAYNFSLVTFEYFLLVLVRIASFFAVAPFFGLSSVNTRVKAGFSAVVALLVFQVIPHQGLQYTGMLEYSIIIVKEAVTGLIFGMMANSCTYILGFAGRMIDMEIGFAMAQEFNPMTRAQESITGNMYLYTILLLLLISDMYHYIVRAIVDTFTLIPLNTQIFNWEYLAMNMVRFIVDMFVIGFRIMLPVFACALTLNCILGIMAKVAPQMNMFAVGLQIKIFAGYAVVLLSVMLLPKVAAMVGNEIKILLRMVVRGLYAAG